MSDASVSFGREICGELDASLRREWLVTNGLGGYASGTVAGIATRRYHGLLVATLTPCVGRTVLVGGAVEDVVYEGRTYGLSTHEYGDGTIDPHGYRFAESFELDGTLPVWQFRIADALIERRVWMEYGSNTSYVRYTLVSSTLPIDLNVRPLVTYRDFHTLRSGEAGQPEVTPLDIGATVQAFDGAVPLHLRSDHGSFASDGVWFWNFHHRAEAERGLDDRSDLYAAGTFAATLNSGESLTLVFSTDEAARPQGTAALARELERQARLLKTADAETAPPVLQQLVLAADQFLVERWLPAETDANAPPQGAVERGRSIIAGYHWFNDWGRDTMIALPGLTLATRRFAEAAQILRTFARFEQDGLLPNNFPDVSAAVPGYNTADATLWFFVAIHRYVEATRDQSLVDELLPVLCDVVEKHIAGTRFGIGVDPADGLLRAGEAGVQLTWMDARVGDWVVTPRTGKPVEINALWYNALRILAAYLGQRGRADSERYRRFAEQARVSFQARFQREESAHLADVIDGPKGDDWSIRPNQIFAVSLPHALIEGDAAMRVVSAVGRCLYSSFGLRSLSPDDPAYHGDYGGDQLRRDDAYHQGPVWNWLLGPYVEAYVRVHGSSEAAVQQLRPLAAHLRDAGLGSVSEIMEGDAPHEPRGCIAQAWSVGEALRVWRLLSP